MLRTRRGAVTHGRTDARPPPAPAWARTLQTQRDALTHPHLRVHLQPRLGVLLLLRRGAFLRR